MHWNIRASLTQPLDLGERFASESRVDLEDPDGRGLFGCLADLGFDARVITEPTTGGRKYAWADFKLPPQGPLSEAIKAHHAQFERPNNEDWTKNIKAVARPGGDVDLRYEEPAGSKESLIKRLFRR